MPSEFRQTIHPFPSDMGGKHQHRYIQFLVFHAMQLIMQAETHSESSFTEEENLGEIKEKTTVVICCYQSQL